MILTCYSSAVHKLVSPSPSCCSQISLAIDADWPLLWLCTLGAESIKMGKAPTNKMSAMAKQYYFAEML